MSQQPSGLIHESIFEYMWTLIVDIFICTIKSFYYLAEAIFLTLLPDKFRTKKVIYWLIKFKRSSISISSEVIDFAFKMKGIKN